MVTIMAVVMSLNPWPLVQIVLEVQIHGVILIGQRSMLEILEERLGEPQMVLIMREVVMEPIITIGSVPLFDKNRNKRQIESIISKKSHSSIHQQRKKQN